MRTAVKTLGAKQAALIAVLVVMQVGSLWFLFGGAYRIGLGIQSELIFLSISVIAGLGLTGYCIALLVECLRNARSTQKYGVHFYSDCVALTLGALLGLAPLWLGIWFTLAVRFRG
jgi:hypothetical protein